MSTEFSNNIVQMFEHLEGFVSSKTVVGEPIVAGNTTLIPLVDVSFGMGGGGSGVAVVPAPADGTKKDPSPVSGMGAAAKIKPSAVLVITDGNVQLVNIKHQDSVNKLIDLIPSITSKFDFGNLFSKNKAQEEPEIKTEL